jgi:hypothetical protein
MVFGGSQEDLQVLSIEGCSQAGRYPHLVKTDRKHDGLNVYQLDESKVPPSVAIATAKAMQTSDDSDGAELPSGGSERSSE